MDETAEQRAENRDQSRIDAVMQKFDSNGAIEYYVLPRAYNSDYIDASAYNKHIRSLENEIRRDTNTGGSREAGRATQRQSDLSSLRSQIQDIYRKQENAFRQWERGAREKLERRKIQASRGAIGGVAGQHLRDTETLADAPRIRGATGPDRKVVQAAERYARSAGIDLKRQAVYVDIDEKLAKDLAKAYGDMADDPLNPAVAEAYRELVKQTTAQYQALVLDYISNTTDAAVHADWLALATVDVEEDSEVTLLLNNVPLIRAAELVMHQLAGDKAVVRVHKGMIFISTPDAIEAFIAKPK